MSGEPMITIYHWEPHSVYLKPLLALYEKQARFTSRYFDPTRFEQFAAEFPANVESGLHLEREGPILVAEDTVISSSFFMLEYIAEAVAGPPLLPGGALEHYRARAWGQYLALVIGPAVSALGCARYLAPELRKRDASLLRAQVERIESRERREAWAAVVDSERDQPSHADIRERLNGPVKRFEEALSASPWLAGAQYSIADIDAFSMLSPLTDLAPDVVNETDTPRLLDFLHRVRSRPAVGEALALSRTGKPHEAYVPGAESSRWG